MNFPARCGKHHIGNLLDPKPHEIDLEAIDDNLRRAYRFNGAPGSLSVYQHVRLVAWQAQLHRDEAFDDSVADTVIQWALHHDDHEAIIGDIVGPVKSLISAKTNIIEIVEVKLDKAICAARGIPYPSETVRGLVHRYDMAAQTLEWRFAMRQEPAPWNPHCPEVFMKSGNELIEWARSQR